MLGTLGSASQVNILPGFFRRQFQYQRYNLEGGGWKMNPNNYQPAPFLWPFGGSGRTLMEILIKTFFFK